MTAKQKAVLNLLAQGQGENLYERAAASGIEAQTLSRWLSDEGFRRWFFTLADRESDGERQAIWRALTEKCRKGDLAAIRLYFDLKGLPEKEQPAKPEGVKIVDDIR